jgi:hypothetical protein
MHISQGQKRLSEQYHPGNVAQRPGGKRRVNKRDEGGMVIMKTSVSPKEATVQHMINRMSVQKLIELWEETEKRIISIELAKVREWIMNALEAKNPEAYERWLNSEYTTPESDMPRTYFIAE